MSARTAMALVVVVLSWGTVVSGCNSSGAIAEVKAPSVPMNRAPAASTERVPVAPDGEPRSVEGP